MQALSHFCEFYLRELDQVLAKSAGDKSRASSSGRGEGSILRYTRALCSPQQGLPQEKLFYQIRTSWGFIRGKLTQGKETTQLQPVLAILFHVGVCWGNEGDWGGSQPGSNEQFLEDEDIIMEPERAPPTPYHRTALPFPKYIISAYK